jgi:hypothetical protein
MNKKTAFEILNLDAGVSLGDAKKAYRNLAKKYHPDLARNNSRSEMNAEAKMKEINLAFRYLVPLLRPNVSIRKTKEQKNYHKTVKKGVIDPILSKLVKLITRFFFIKTDSRAFEGTRKKDKKIHFDDVLKNVDKACFAKKRMTEKFEKKYSQKINPYQTYMALKRKMKLQNSRRHQNMGIGKIDKIDPITPVTPVRKN